MMNRKNLKDLAWNVEESEYRAAEELSYSKLSTFFREGFKAIPEMDKKIDSAALRYGSLVDFMLTQNGPIESQFYILDAKRPTDAISGIIEDVFNDSGEMYDRLEKVPHMRLVEALDNASYYTNWSEPKRVELLYKLGGEYYDILKISKEKTVVSSDDYKNAEKNVKTLISHPYTSWYFDDSERSNKVNYYQLKFKMPYKPIGLRCMFDLIIVDYENKIIIPCDLKTTGHQEYEFENSFFKWGYFIQAQLYTSILKYNIEQDDYFKDFKIEDYRFIVINKYSNTPLVWIFPWNKHNGDYKFMNGEIIKGWKSIYTEMTYHIVNSQYKYPKEAIDNDGAMILKNIIPVDGDIGVALGRLNLNRLKWK